MRQIELLIPARDLDAGMAAVDHGADAVYIGGPGFGARAAAGNPVGDIGRLVGYAHPFGVKVYAALNTLVYENELRQAANLAQELISAGVDALIIQDPACLMMGLEGAVFHASTQMCNTSAEKVRFLARSGFSRVVLERGLSLENIRRVTGECGVETECFIHGAICVGYSGACYLSRSMGPRSGNRGECSQPCRLRYDLEDGNGNKLLRDKHLLSVRDLNLSQYVGRMIDAGVTSFKVEGRLKETEYVCNLTAWYRSLLDEQIARRPGLRKSSAGSSVYGFTPDPAKSFSRGFTTWAAGGMKKGTASFDTPKSLGEYIGRVVKVRGDRFEIGADSADTLSPGDGICFMAGGNLAGTNVNYVDGPTVFPNRTDGITPGTQIYRNHDHRFVAAVSRSRTRRSIPVDIRCRVAEDGLTVTATDDEGNSAQVSLAAANGYASDTARMVDIVGRQFRKTGESIFEPRDLEPIHGDRVPFFTVSALNALRRELLEQLTARRLDRFDKTRSGAVRSAVRDDGYPYPLERLDGAGNVTNSLAARFWRMHGVRSIETAYDLRPSLDGEVVMTTPFCLRRELGSCLKESPSEKGRELYLRHGGHRYRLDFDCAHCLMRLIKEKE